MALIHSLLEGPTPRPLLIIGTPVAGVALVILFVFLGFPYNRLAPGLARQISSATGNEVVVERIEPRITLGGPGMAARNVYMLRPDGGSVSIDPLVVRPAWSTSWLTGAPSLHMDMTSPQGRVHGTMRIADDMAWDMRIDDLDLAHLPLALPDGVTISGLLAADVDLQTSAEDQSLAGQVVFEAHDGTLSHPLIPIEIDFSDVTGNVVLGGETLADIKDIQLDGSVIAAQLSGQVEPTSRRGQNPIKMNIDLQIKDPGMQNMLRSMGVRLDDQGRAVFRLGGSLQSPKPY